MIARTRRQFRRGSHRDAFILVDVIGGIALLVAVAALLAVAMQRHASASDRLANSRDAARLAEETLSRLQTKQPAPAPVPDQSVSVKLLDDPAPSNQRWAEVTATVHQRVVTLTGLVPKTEAAR